MKFTNTTLLLAAWLAMSASAASISNPKAPARSLYKSPQPECKDGYCRMGCEETANPGNGIPSFAYQEGEPWCWLIEDDVDSVNNKENKWVPCDENGSCDGTFGVSCAYPDGGAGGCGV